MSVDYKAINRAMQDVRPDTEPAKRRELIMAATMEELPDSEIMKNRFDELSLDELSETVQRLWAALDRGADRFISELTEEIKDNYSAKQSVELYTAEWFRSLLLSVDAKSRLATALIQTCHPYLGRNVPSIWLNLAMKQPETMKAMEFTLEDATA